ncbi:phenylacetic acid degradation bifunctional protein PaaZ [Sagittula salina]|uniref:Phenylacetic acid degradation bifunctional protein PaaZ n=1 Tax=Sagittula salina TaxID=2820268 RepID=A0A940RZW4_9RHOB|nr:phenylacetic acid degradation bifunctional protein PaaZ [Sagittula salina]MBP0482403.1 phenylacetic acid degradation bifunctional protein PaaZ [Sagittula salina]
MAILEPASYVAGDWIAPGAAARDVFGPVDGARIARVGGAPDTGRMLSHAIDRGGPALRAMTFHDRARMLKALAGYIDSRKEELYALNPLTGATRRDGSVDIEGGIITMTVIAGKGRREMPDGHVYLDGAVERISRSGSFLAQHIAVPRRGVAVHINAFNFPVWGMLEKLAPTLLAGMPAIVKPATQTCFLTEACFRMIVESELLPEGAVQLICGPTGDLLDRLGPQDVVSFTGSADTALTLRGNRTLLAQSVRFMAEADSLNATILGPDVTPGSTEFDHFVKQVVTEMTVKAGQKCTAIRRILVPDTQLDAVTDAVADRLRDLTIGDPSGDARMGALASAEQRADVLGKAARIGCEAVNVLDGLTAPDGPGFVAPMLFRCDDPSGDAVHDTEAFGPVATVMPYANVTQAAALANRGRGSLVASLVTADPDIARAITLETAAWHGRLHITDATCVKEATGHGAPLPHLVHGGPGRAGGGEELGGVRGVLHYMQRTAVQGSPDTLTAITGQWMPGAGQVKGSAHPFQRTFDEIAIGGTILTEGREVTLEDIEHFANFTGDTFYAHMDDAAAKANPFFPGRVAHGYLLLSFAAGLFVQPDPGPVLANTGLNALSFQKPVSPGDRVHVRLTAKRKTRRTDSYGEVAWNVTLYNQDNDQVAEYELLTMVSYTR